MLTLTTPTQHGTKVLATEEIKLSLFRDSSTDNSTVYIGKSQGIYRKYSYSLVSDIVIPPTLFFFKTAEAIQGLLRSI